MQFWTFEFEHLNILSGHFEFKKGQRLCIKFPESIKRNNASLKSSINYVPNPQNLALTTSVIETKGRLGCKKTLIQYDSSVDYASCMFLLVTRWGRIWFGRREHLQALMKRSIPEAVFAENMELVRCFFMSWVNYVSRTSFEVMFKALPAFYSHIWLLMWVKVVTKSAYTVHQINQCFVLLRFTLPFWAV